MKLLFTSLLFLLVLNFHANSQIDTSYSKRNEFGKISFVRFGNQSGNFPSINQSQAILNQYLSPSADIEFRLVKSEVDNIGFKHDKYNVFYKGIKVDGIGYVIHGKEGKIISMDGNYRDIPPMDLRVNISKELSLQNALSVIKAKKYIWESPNFEKELKQISQDNSATYYPEAELTIAKFSNSSGSAFHLCYKFEITALDPFSSENVFVDAKSGAILKRISKLRHINDVQGSADTRYSGTQSIWANNYWGTGYTLRELNTSGRDIYTLNYNHGGSALDFIDADNSWTAAEWNNANKDNIALDIHWASEKCFDYFKTTFNRNGYNNYQNGSIANYAHYGTNIADAFYVRYFTSQLYGNILCGDGDSQYGPFGSLDTYGHEYGHGYWDFTVGYPDNEPMSKEFGAIDEGFADIWGTIIEANMAPNKQRWISGEEIISGGMRNLSNPNSFSMPDTYHGQYWVNTDCGTPNASNDYCGIHTNMSVPGYMFYLLCESGSGVNDIGNAVAVTGIGMTEAAQIVYRAELVYMGYLPNTNVAFNGTRDAMVQAAIDLYGANSCEVYSVMEAWYAVGVGTAYTGVVGINGDNNFCITSNNYTISNLPIGSTVQWQVSPQNIATINSSNSTQTTLTKNSDGVITLSAIITTCGGQFTITKVNIAVGNTFPQGVTYASSNYNYYSGPLLSSYSFFLPSGQWGLATFNITDTRYSSFSWTPVSVPSGSSWAIYGPQNQQLNLNIEAVGSAYNSNTITIQLNAQGPCGAYTNYFSATAVVSGWYGFSMSPNPAQDELTVSVDNSNIKTNSQSYIYGIKITDGTATVRKMYEYKSGINSTRISLAGLSSGLYTLSVFDGKQWYSKQLVIQK